MKPPRVTFPNQKWMLISHKDLVVERLQAGQEGRDLSSVVDRLDALMDADLEDAVNQERAGALLDDIQSLPMAFGYPYHEPSDLEGIRACRPASVPLPDPDLSEGFLRERVLGAWVGRACGCLLGKPVEGIRGREIEGYLRGQGRWPLNGWFSLDAPDNLIERYGIRRIPSLYEGGITCMPVDDDTNYTVAALALTKSNGYGFTPMDVALFWLSHFPMLSTCTAERVAYRNLACSIPPPHSAMYRNPYREWIGAQIRGDFFGYANPGNPERAASMAWRDASISHVRNGIYGEMWVAAMLASAYSLDTGAGVIEAGLAQVPENCRLSLAVRRILGMWGDGKTFEDALADLRGRWNEYEQHDWCHAVSNAEIVAMALLWGGGDFGRTICLAVMAGFDTDCNGATAGSVLGMMLGKRGIPEMWSLPMNDTLHTGVSGYTKVSLTGMARETVDLIKRSSGCVAGYPYS